MKKRKIVSFLLVLSMIVSSLLFLGQILPFVNVSISAGDRILVYIITTLLFIYNKSLTKPELMPSILTSEKEVAKDKQVNKPPDVSFSDVAGLEIKNPSVLLKEKK